MMKRSPLLRSLGAATAVALCITVGATAARADSDGNPAPPTGYNDAVDLVRGVGSDTTYYAMVQAAKLYNQSQGCNLFINTTNNPATGPAGQCETDRNRVQDAGVIGGGTGRTFTGFACTDTDPGVADSRDANDPALALEGGPLANSASNSRFYAGCVVGTENYDHDEVVNNFPTGSGDGKDQLCGTIATAAPAVGGTPLAPAYDRSSSSPSICGGNPQPAGGADLTWVRFAREGLVIGVDSTTPWGAAVKAQGITAEDLKAIFLDCRYTTWDQLLGSDPAWNGVPIKPFGGQSASGTVRTFKTFAKFPTNTTGFGSCVPSPESALENNATQIPAADRPNTIYFMSSGRATSAPYTRAGLDFSVPLGANFASAAPDADPSTPLRSPSKSNFIAGLYPMTRDLWNAYRTPGDDNDDPCGTTVNTRTVCEGTYPPVDTANGASAFLKWMCQTTHDIDVENGVQIQSEIIDAVGSTGGFAATLTGFVSGTNYNSSNCKTRLTE